MIHKQFKFPKPIVFFDLETTGINITEDRIVQIAMVKHFPDYHTESLEYLINPEMPIPPESSVIHGITDDMVKDCPTFKQVAHKILRFIDHADLGGFNIQRFDLPLLAEEFLRCDIDFDFSKKNIIDVQTIYHKMETRNLSAAYRFYCNKDLENAHSALADVQATYEVFLSQLEKYNDILTSYNDVVEFSKYNNFVDFSGRIVLNENNVPVFNFGKYKGQPVSEVFKKEPQYYDWIQKSDFPLYTKKILTKIWLENKMSSR